jgi:toxin ParE1/3/4
VGQIRHDLDNAVRSFAVYPWVVLYKPLPDGEGVFILRVVDGRRDLPRLILR